ncbi:MAG TPA: dockerin type I domain-containing protein [Terriglobales bacterium]|nr:dockerin type I domain-containing protein [Terriglobales bacterium]
MSAFAGAALLLQPGPAHAIPACSAAQISQSDPGCPSGTGPCTITLNFEIATGCELDFGARAVTLGTNATLTIGNGRVMLRAGSFTVGARGTINGQGTTGGAIAIRVDADVMVVGSPGRGRIDVSATGVSGSIDIIAGGNIIVSGDLVAAQQTDLGSGGEIFLAADGDIRIESGGTVSANGNQIDAEGGSLDLRAGRDLILVGTTDASGGDGGTIDLEAGRDISIAGADASAKRGSGLGGAINVIAERNLIATSPVTANGAGPDEDTGGCGGLIDMESSFGSMNITTRLSATGAAPDGTGGEILLAARGNISATNTSTITTSGAGAESDGGCLSIDGGVDVSLLGSIDASGGFAGAGIEIFADRNLGMGGMITSRGRSTGSDGGTVDATTRLPNAVLSVSGRINVTGGFCSTEGGCGTGGDVSLTSCTVVVDTGAVIDAVAPDGGNAELFARQNLTVRGRIEADSNASTGNDGTITLIFPADGTLNIGAGTFDPPPMLDEREHCTDGDEEGCLVPCPVCGNGSIEFPETCDSGEQPPQHCDGCSPACRIETCNDLRVCTTDMCDSALGCFSVPVTVPCTEPPTPTPTPTATPTITRTPTVTFTPSLTLPPSLTPTATIPPTVTPTPAPGDINCDGSVDAADLDRLTAALFGDDTTCGGADVNGDGALTAADLVGLVELLAR